MPHIVCHLKQRDSIAVNFDRVKRTYLSVTLLAETITDEGGEEMGAPEENP